LLKKQQLINQTIKKPEKLNEELLPVTGKYDLNRNRVPGNAIPWENLVSSNPPDLRIPLRSTDLMKIIELLWSLLLIPIEDSPVVLKSKADINNIVGQLFSLKNEAKTDNRKDLIDLSVFETRHRSLIEFLMRFSKLRIEGNTQNNTVYCSLLKSSFLGIYGGGSKIMESA
jgi:hypothetical protein